MTVILIGPEETRKIKLILRNLLNNSTDYLLVFIYGIPSYQKNSPPFLIAKMERDKKARES